MLNENVTTAKEALEAANLNWKVNIKPLVVDLGQGEVSKAPKYKAVLREGDNKVLGVVGNRYSPVDNAAVFEVADQVINSIGGFYTKAVSVREDSQVVLQVKLPTTLKLGKDQVDRFLTLTNSFDGTLSLRAFVTPIRFACTNMVRLMLAKAENSVSIRHSSKALSRLADVQNVLKLTEQYHSQFDQVAEALYRAKFTQQQMVRLAENLVPSQIDEDGKEYNSTRAVNNRNQIVRLFEEGKGHKETEILGTAWAAFNAVAEYVDHERNSRVSKGQDLETKRFESAYFGSGNAMKNRAFELIRTEIGV